MSLFAVACQPAENPGQPGSEPMFDSRSDLPCDPAADDDGDCILNALERCLDTPIPDRDLDGQPDFTDPDADGDGIPDSIEVGGDCSQPRDSDGNAIPDYLDSDSDGDNVPDRHEDRDGDGHIGSCRKPCSGPAGCDAAASERCSLGLIEADGVCVSIDCLDGDSNPRDPDTDGDGVADGSDPDLAGTGICSEPATDNAIGLAAAEYVDSASTPHAFASWRIALAPETVRAAVAITTAGRYDSALIADLPASDLAGFLASRASQSSTATAESDAVVPALLALPQLTRVSTRASGTSQSSSDGFAAVLGTVLDITTAQPTDAVAVREAILAALLGRSAGEITVPDPGWTGANDTAFVVALQAVHRPARSQTIFMGAVARRAEFDDISRVTAIRASDLADGTALTLSGNLEAHNCEQVFVTAPPTADMIFVIDEAGSTTTERMRLANAAGRLFTDAARAGLDLRVAVTDMEELGPGGAPGIFASRTAGGTGDRWLTPADASQFAGDIMDPSGPDPRTGDSENGLTQARAAITRHLPRDNGDPQRIRENAALAVVYMSDEKPEEVEEAGILPDGDVAVTESQIAQILALAAPFLDQLDSQGATAHVLAEPLPFGHSACSGTPEHAYGYYEMARQTGGHIAAFCQADMAPTLSAIIDSTTARASPVRLPDVPIAATIRVTRNGALIPRSRNVGWDYHASSNAIVFYNVPFSPLAPANIVVSYRRWATQASAP